MYDKLRIAHIFPAQKTTENDTIVKELFRSTKKKKKRKTESHNETYFSHLFGEIIFKLN